MGARPRTSRRKIMENNASQMFAKGIVSGWMIATKMWMSRRLTIAK